MFPLNKDTFYTNAVTSNLVITVRTQDSTVLEAPHYNVQTLCLVWSARLG